MRSLVLLGKQDLGARKAFGIFCLLSDLLVGFCNVFLFVFRDNLCRAVSNDAAVQRWLAKILWVLILHTQTRIDSINAAFLFIPLGKGMFRTLVTFASFYFIASPFAGVVALTDVLTTSVETKMVACVSATSVAQVLLAVCFFLYLQRLDWHEAGVIINGRANNDRQEQGLGIHFDERSMDVLGPSADNPGSKVS